MVQQYIEHSKAILSSGRFKFNERRGLGRIFLFGHQNRYDLQQGFPLLTTKKLSFKNIAHELIWFLSGNTNIKYLVDNKVHIWDDDAFNYNLKRMVGEGIFPEVFPKFSEGWLKAKEEYIQRVKEDDEFSQRWGDLGPVYGSQWRHWPTPKDPNGIDQILNLIEGVKKDPTTARHIVSAWNPDEVPNMALPPCHTLFQVNSDGETLDLQLYQRACDMFLGVPYNIASYALLTQIVAQQTGLKPGEFVHTFGDVHFYTGAGERAKWYRENRDELKARVKLSSGPEDYSNVLAWLNKKLPQENSGREGMDHVTGILEQLTREPRPLPRVCIANKQYDKLTIDDFVLEGYDNPWPNIKRQLAV